MLSIKDLITFILKKKIIVIIIITIIIIIIIIIIVFNSEHKNLTAILKIRSTVKILIVSVIDFFDHVAIAQPRRGSAT